MRSWTFWSFTSTWSTWRINELLRSLKTSAMSYKQSKDSFCWPSSSWLQIFTRRNLNSKINLVPTPRTSDQLHLTAPRIIILELEDQWQTGSQWLLHLLRCLHSRTERCFTRRVSTNCLQTPFWDKSARTRREIKLANSSSLLSKNVFTRWFRTTKRLSLSWKWQGWLSSCKTTNSMRQS